VPRVTSAAVHGGSRKGAGRPPEAAAARTVRVGPIRLTPEEAATFRERVAASPYSAQQALRAALRAAKWID